MGLINAKPRFALDSDSGRLYDYETKKYIDAKGTLPDVGGSWDLAKVAELIGLEQPIKGAFTHDSHALLADAHASLKDAHAALDKIAQADKDFIETINATGGTAAAPATPPASNPPA